MSLSFIGAILFLVGLPQPSTGVAPGFSKFRSERVG